MPTPPVRGSNTEDRATAPAIRMYCCDGSAIRVDGRGRLVPKGLPSPEGMMSHAGVSYLTSKPAIRDAHCYVYLETDEFALSFMNDSADNLEKPPLLSF